MNKPSIFGKINHPDPVEAESTITSDIQSLESYLDRLVESLQRGELPVNLKPVTQVFDRLILDSKPSIDLAADKFVELYNDVPNILTGYAIDSTISNNSYRQTNIDLITFERFNRGTYWIFPTDKIGKPGAAWLVPNPLKQLQIHRTKSLKFCFDFERIVEHSNDPIVLIKPALVQLLPDRNKLTWKLSDRGSISNSSNNSHAIVTTDLTQQIDRTVQSQLTAFQTTITQELNELKIAHKDLLQQFNQLKTRSIDPQSTIPITQETPASNTRSIFKSQPKTDRLQTAMTAKDYFDRGRQKEQKHDFAGALADYDRTIELDPNYANAHFNRGLLLRNSSILKNQTSAISSFRTAARLYKQKGHIEIYNSLLETLKELGVNE
jgi:hypothetical protein